MDIKIKESRIALYSENKVIHEYFLNKNSFSNEESKLYIILSKKCNLNCIYCFQNKENDTNRFYSEDYIINYIVQAQEKFDKIVIYGGEPFIDINFNILKKLLPRVYNNKLLVFTNGNFSEKFLNLILQYRKKFDWIIITIDGDKYTHNLRRKNKNNDSYELAMGNIKKLTKNRIKNSLQINVDKLNIYSIDSLFEKLSKNRNEIYNISINPVKYSKNDLGYLEFIKAYLSYKDKYPGLYLNINNRTYNNFINIINNKKISKHRCGLEKTRVINFENNTYYSCPQNEKTLLEVGNDNITKYVNQVKYNNKRCISCDYRYVCSYGCPFHNINYVGSCEENMRSCLNVIFNHYINSLKKE